MNELLNYLYISVTYTNIRNLLLAKEIPGIFPRIFRYCNILVYYSMGYIVLQYVKATKYFHFLVTLLVCKKFAFARPGYYNGWYKIERKEK